MTAAAIETTPQFYTAGDLRDVIAEDLDARGIGCVVEIGEFDPLTMRGEPRCMIVMGDSVTGEPAGHYQPGMWVPPPGTFGKVAAPLADDAATFTLKIHAPAAPGIDSGATEAQRATDQLRRHIIAAMRRPHASPFRVPMRTKWPTRIEGYESFVYGSLCEVSLTVASPILDDAREVGTVETFTVTTSFLVDGTETTGEDTTVAA